MNIEKYLEDNFYMVQNDIPIYHNPVLKSKDGGKVIIELKSGIIYNKIDGSFTKIRESLRWAIEDFCRLSWEKERGF